MKSFTAGDFIEYMNKAIMYKDGEDYTVVLNSYDAIGVCYRIEVWDTNYMCVHQRDERDKWLAQQLFVAAALWYGTP